MELDGCVEQNVIAMIVVTPKTARNGWYTLVWEWDLTHFGQSDPIQYKKKTA